MTLVIRNCTVLPVNGDEPVADGVVVVEGERITAVGRRDRVRMPGNSEARVIDAAGGTVLPGLIDMHVHVVGEIPCEEQVEGFTPRVVTAHMLRLIPELEAVVCGGVTGLRDAGFPHHGIFALRDAIDAGRLVGPRLYLCGRALTATGGHGARLSVQVDGPAEVRRAARAECKAGADWIKLMATGGTATPGERTLDVQLTVEEMAAAADEAHRRGKKVCAHCSCLEGARALIEAGADSIEHGIVLDDGAVHEMRARGIWLVPSLKCTQVEGESGPESGIADFIREKARQIYKIQMGSFQRALAAGVAIAAGTDAGPAYMPLGRESLVSELALMVELGMSPGAAIESCTRQAARLLGADADLGSVEPGKLADLVVVDGDPLADIRALNSVRCVVKGGRIVAS